MIKILAVAAIAFLLAGCKASLAAGTHDAVLLWNGSLWVQVAPEDMDILIVEEGDK